MQEDELDGLLNESSPASPLSFNERRAVELMVAESAPRKKPLRWGRPVAVGAAVVAIVGIGSAAAAAVTGFWAPWAQEDPLAVLYYELPSGVPCEMRIGNVKGSLIEVTDVIRSSLADVSFSDIDVARTSDEHGFKEPLDDDDAYQIAYNWTVVTHIEEALNAHGFEGLAPQYSAQGKCG